MHKLTHKKRDEAIESGFKFTGPLRPYPYSFTGKRKVPDHIKKPDYANTGQPNSHFQNIADKTPPVHSPEEILTIRKVCLIARKAIDIGHRLVAPGVTTE